MCWLQRGVRWRLTCASKCLAIMATKKNQSRSYLNHLVHQLQVLVNRCIHRILKIFWLVQISNQELWARAKQKPIELEIRHRKWGWLGHTLRRPPGDIAKAALEWNPQRTRSRGRHQTWRRTISEKIRHQGKTWNEVNVLASNGVRWQNFVRALWGMMGNYIYIYIYVLLLLLLHWVLLSSNPSLYLHSSLCNSWI